MLQDLRHALRLFSKRPGFAVLTVAVLALGIGATTSIFSVVDAVLLRAAPYERPHELVSVWNTYPGWRGHEVLDRLWDRINLSWPEYQQWRQHQTAFGDVGIHGARTMALAGHNRPRELNVGLASPSLFELLGRPPQLGRGFRDDEVGPGAPRLAVVSHALWIDLFNASTDAVGWSLRLNDQPYEIVGVLPAGFRFRPLGD